MVAAVAHEERPLHARHVGQAPLDGGRGDRLPAGVLVHVFQAVDDLEVAARPPHEDVAGRRPALLSRGDRQVVQVGPHVGPRDLELALGAEPGPDAGKGDAHRAVLVLPGRRHGDPPDRLGHAEAAAQLHPVALEEAEDRGVEVARRGEAPAQAVAHDRPQGRFPAFGPREGALAQLRPAPRDADEPGRADPGQGARERLERRVPGEHVRSAPEQHPEHLEVAAERVEERQVAQQRLALTHGGEGGGPGEALRDEGVAGVHDALGQPGAAGGEHDSRRLVEVRSRVRRQGALDLSRGELGGHLGEPRLRRPPQRSARVEEQDARAGEACPLEPHPLLLPLDDDHAELQPPQDGAEAVRLGVGVDRRDRDAVREAREVRAGGVDAVRGEDRDPGPAARGAQEGGRGALEPARHRLVAPARGAVLGRLDEEGTLGVLGHALGQHRPKGVARGSYRREGRLRPAVPRLRPAEGLQVRRPACRVEESVPQRGRHAAVREAPLGLLEEGTGAGLEPGGDRSRHGLLRPVVESSLQARHRPIVSREERRPGSRPARPSAARRARPSGSRCPPAPRAPATRSGRGGAPPPSP